MKARLRRVGGWEWLHYYDDKCVRHVVDPDDPATFPPGLHGYLYGLCGNVTGLRGNVTGLRGDVTGLRGNASSLWGDVSGLRGNVTGIFGEATGLHGDLWNDCALTDEDRRAGVDIATLVAEEEK